MNWFAMRNGRILLIEDDKDVIELFSDLASELGFELRVCDEDKGWENILEFRPDIAIIDTGLKGWELCKRIKSSLKTSSVKVILLSTREEVGDRIQAYRLGAEGMYTKPIDKEEISKKIREIVYQRMKESTSSNHEGGIKGMLRDMSLVDLLQVLNMGKKTALVYLNKGREEGKVFLKDGEVVHAECGQYHGEDALYYMLKWDEGRFDVEPDVPSHQETIDSPLEGLLLEGMKRMDEVARDEEEGRSTIPEADPDFFNLIKRLYDLGILERKE